MEVTCALGKPITIGASGSDGYQDQTSKTFATDTGTAELYVPGGDQGVTDTIIIALGVGDDARTLAIVF